MTLKTVTVQGQIYNPDGTPAAGVEGYATLNQPETDNGIVIPTSTFIKADADGKFSIQLWPNARGSGQSQYIVRAYTRRASVLNLVIMVPDVDVPVVITDIAIAQPYPPIDQSLQALLSAQEAAIIAKASKDDAIGAAVAAGQSAESASQSAGTANAAKTEAQTAAGLAVDAQTDIHNNWQGKLDIASQQAETATTQAEIATDKADEAAESAATANAAKTAAELARDAAMVGAVTYPDEATGRAAVTDGEYFKVIGSGDVAAREYRRTNASASVLVAEYPSVGGVVRKAEIKYEYVNGNIIGTKTLRYTNFGLDHLFIIRAVSYYDSIVLSVKEGDLLFLLNDKQSYIGSDGAVFAFFADDPNANRSQSRITDNRVSVTDPATSLKYRKVTVPPGAKYLMLNTRFTNAAGTINTSFNWAIHLDVFNSDYTQGVEVISEISDSKLLTKRDINEAKAEVLQQSKQYADEKINIESSFNNGNFIKNTGFFYNGIGVSVGGLTVSASFSAGVVPVESSELLYVFNTANNFNTGAGYGLIFLAENPNTNRSQSAIAYTSETATHSDSGTTYRKITVPENAKFVMINTRFSDLQIIWAIHKNEFSPSYERGVENIDKINGINIGTPAPILPIEHLLGSSYRFYGKKVFCFGDSITQGTEGGYVQYLSQILGCEVSNFGSSGGTASRCVDIITAGSGLPKRNSPTENTVWPTKDFTTCSAVTIQIGTNDYVSGSIADIPIGDVSDYADPLDYWALFPSNYVANIALCIEYIKSKNSECEIFLITPPYRNIDGDTPSRIANLLPFLRLLSEYYSVPLINSLQESGIGFKYMKANIKYSYDGIHFNALGNKMWGTYIARKILSSG